MKMTMTDLNTGTPSVSNETTLILNPVLPFIVLFSIALFVLLWRLGVGSLADCDEAIYAQVSREIVQSKDWLTLSWGISHGSKNHLCICGFQPSFFNYLG